MTATIGRLAPCGCGPTGAEAARAIRAGLAAAQWHHSDVPRKVTTALMQRRDGPAQRDTALWLGLSTLTAAARVATWGTGWAVRFLAVYGVPYGAACASRWHPCGHGTAFRTAWLVDLSGHLARFKVLRNPTSGRCRHLPRHAGGHRNLAAEQDRLQAEPVAAFGEFRADIGSAALLRVLYPVRIDTSGQDGLLTEIGR